MRIERESFFRRSFRLCMALRSGNRPSLNPAQRYASDKPEKPGKLGSNVTASSIL